MTSSGRIPILSTFTIVRSAMAPRGSRCRVPASARPRSRLRCAGPGRRRCPRAPQAPRQFYFAKSATTTRSAMGMRPDDDSNRYRRIRLLGPEPRPQLRRARTRGDWRHRGLLAPRLSRALARHPAAATARRWRTLIADPAIDAVAIATPVATHFELAWRRCGPASTSWSRSR